MCCINEGEGINVPTILGRLLTAICRKTKEYDGGALDKESGGDISVFIIVGLEALGAPSWIDL